MKANVFMVLAAGLLLGACSNDNEPTDNANGVAAVFTTNLDGRVQTRMADEEWAEDDAIGIFSLNNEMQGVMIDGVEQSNNAVNLKYTRTPAGTWDGGTTAFRFKNQTDVTVNFMAYYPYTMPILRTAQEERKKGQSLSKPPTRALQDRRSSTSCLRIRMGKEMHPPEARTAPM